jgi:hypothetical protein
MLDPDDRKILWDRMMEIEQDDPVAFISGWFFDQPLDQISRYDLCDFLCWSMFDGRSQEHLTTQELHELECFLEDFEYRISLKLFGAREESDEDAGIDKENITDGREKERQVLTPRRHQQSPYEEDGSISSTSEFTGSTGLRRLRPKKSKYLMFQQTTFSANSIFVSHNYNMLGFAISFSLSHRHTT